MLMHWAHINRPFHSDTRKVLFLKQSRYTTDEFYAENGDVSVCIGLWHLMQHSLDCFEIFSVKSCLTSCEKGAAIDLPGKQSLVQV